MSEHTPGPWGIKKTNDGSTAVFSGETGNWVAAVFKSTPLTQQANARLIASAPNLLEALENLLSAMEGRYSNDEINVVAAREAIAKATGIAP